MRPSITRQEAIRAIAVARSAVSTPEALRTLLEDYQAKTVLEALEQAYGGVTNEFLALLHTEISGLDVDVVGEPDERHPCPCCKRLTLTELYAPSAGTGYDICGHCGWEDDGTVREDARSSVNRGTMADCMERIGRDAKLCEKWRRE